VKDIQLMLPVPPRHGQESAGKPSGGSPTGIQIVDPRGGSALARAVEAFARIRPLSIRWEKSI
jgi:hypothetical protein